MKAVLSRGFIAGTLVLLALCAQNFVAHAQSADTGTQDGIERAAVPVKAKAKAKPQVTAGLDAADTIEREPKPQAGAIPVAAARTIAAQPAVADGRSQTEAQPTSEIYRGTGTVVGAPAPLGNTETASVDEAGDITLNFVNADVRDVAKAILGDFLKLNYAVGANVQGSVTIQTSQPLARDKVLPVFEQALKLNGMALVKADNIFKVVPLADAPHEAGATVEHHGPLQPGYGVSIVPLRYVGANEMEKLLTPLAPTQGIIHADPVRNVLMIEGTEQDRRTMLDDIALFDVDWLSGMSFALYTPRYTDADDLARELNQIVGGGSGPLSGVVRIVPITRLNSVLAISPQAKYLEQLRSWVNRLDRPGQGSDRRIFVYHVENGRASDLAAVLVKVLFGTTYESTSKHAAPPGDVFATPAQTAGGTAANTPPNATDMQPAEQEVFESGGSGYVPKEMANVNITADESHNSLVIMATPQQFGVIENALHQLDTAPLQVLLEAAIAEVTLTNDLKYGVQYFFQPNSHHQVVLSNSESPAITPVYPGFSYIFQPGSNIKIILNALSDVTHVEVISSPQVMVLNNQTATLQVGDQVPILTAEQQSTATTGAPLVNTVEYRDTGVILKVTPRVNQGGNVMMDISQEVSDVADTSASTAVDSPTIELRKINSTVAVHDGETVALGGLIKDNRTRSKDGIPFLQDIPLLGNIFRTTENKGDRTELMVLITPHVVDSTEKARAVTQELRQKLPTVQPILERAK